jgi:predicted dehydrogenase
MHRGAAMLDGEAVVSSMIPFKEWATLLEVPQDDRPDVVAIAAHADAATLKALAGAGYHLLMEPPVLEPEQAEELARVVKQSGSILTVAWVESAYPMARAAMSMFRDRKLGPVHAVHIEVHQPRSTSSPGGHVLHTLAPAAENFVSTVTNLRLRAVCCEVVLNHSTRAHDDAQVLLRFEGHTRGAMVLSRTAPRSRLAVQVHGENAALAWSTDAPAQLHFTPSGKPLQVLTPAHAESGPLVAESVRGTMHAEGAPEALANLYRATYEAIRAKREGRARKAHGREFPTTSDLSRACRFSSAAMESARAGGVWAEV